MNEQIRCENIKPGMILEIPNWPGRWKVREVLKHMGQYTIIDELGYTATVRTPTIVRRVGSWNPDGRN